MTMVSRPREHTAPPYPIRTRFDGSGGLEGCTDFPESNSIVGFILQRAPLDDYPMTARNIHDSEINMAPRRKLRISNLTSIKQAENVSGSLYQLGKRLFDDAIIRAKAGTTIIDIKPTTSSPSMDIYHGRRTGPTKIGSPVYNKRARLMNSIRIRPRSEALGRFDHTCGKTLPTIGRALTRGRGNRELGTVGSPSGISLSPSGSISCMDSSTRDVTNKPIPYNDGATITTLTDSEIMGNDDVDKHQKNYVPSGSRSYAGHQRSVAATKRSKLVPSDGTRSRAVVSEPFYPTHKALGPVIPNVLITRDEDDEVHGDSIPPDAAAASSPGSPERGTDGSQEGEDSQSNDR